MKRLLLTIVLVLTTLLMAENPRAMIIFDASGSMWGQIHGKTKIEIARDALNKVVRTWNPNVELGLTVYGHRTKGDCNDIQTVIPVGKVQSYRMISTVNAIQPKGKTPISRSIRMAADALRYTEEKATIILISDGKETCDPDPCGTARQLKKEGIDFVAHVIGFNVDKKTDAQLQCIASATGGEYFSAKNANALNDAMKTIVKKVEKVEPKPMPKPKVIKLDHTLEVTASEKEGGKWIQAYNSIFQDENGKAGDRVATVHSYEKKAGTKQLPVGKYILKSSYNDFKKETAFEIKAGELTKVHLVMGQTGTVEVSASEKEGGKWVRAYNSIFQEEEGKAGDRVATAHSYEKKAGTKQLPVGKYIVKSTYNDFKQEQSFEIKAGEVTQVHILFAPFHISVNGINKCTMITHEVISSRGQVVAESKAPAYKGADFVLSDGTYTIESTADTLKMTTKITIGGADNSSETIVDFGGESSDGSIEGIWHTSEGKATLYLEGTKVHGSYITDNGEIIGEMTYPQRLEGYWIEDKSNTKCSEAKNGRYYWGKITWEFDSHMCSFKGKWNYCDKKPSKNWNGTFFTKLPKEPTKEELIKADNASNPTPPQQVTIGDKQVNIRGVKPEEIAELQKAAAMIQMLGGAIQQPAQNQQQQANDTKADAEFDQMANELEMYTK